MDLVPSAAGPQQFEVSHLTTNIFSSCRRSYTLGCAIALIGSADCAVCILTDLLLLETRPPVSFVSACRWHFNLAGTNYATLSFAFAACLVCHFRLPGVSQPPELRPAATR